MYGILDIESFTLRTGMKMVELQRPLWGAVCSNSAQTPSQRGFFMASKLVKKVNPMLFEKDNLIYNCDCGHPGYLEFSIDPEDEGYMWVLQTDEPSSFWHWLKQWLNRKIYHSEIMLSPDEVDNLIDWLKVNKKKGDDYRNKINLTHQTTDSDQ